MDEITVSDIEKELKNLDSSKAAEESDLPIKIIKDDNIDPFAPILYLQLNKWIETSKLRSETKSVDVTSVLIKVDLTKKHNYRPINILPNFSKVSGRGIYNKICLYFDNTLSKSQRGSRKGFNVKIV